MLTKAVVFLFAAIAVFGLIVSNIPADFRTYQTSSIPEAYNSQVADFFNGANITVYDHQVAGVLTHYDDLTWGANSNITVPGMTNEYIRLYWNWFNIYHETDYLHMDHSATDALGNYTKDHFRYYHKGAPRIAVGDTVFGDYYGVTEPMLLVDYDSAINGSLYDVSCDHVSANILYQPYNRSTLADAWTEGKIIFMMSYSINLNATSMSMWAVISGLLSFQTFNLGIGGFGDTLIGGSISAAFWALVIILLYKTITGVIPWLSGGSGD